MLRYALLLSCLCAALTEARPVRPKKVSQATKEKSTTDEINDGLKEYIFPEHKPLIPLIKLYNEGIRLTHNPRTPVAWELIRDSLDFTELLGLLGVNVDTRTNNQALKTFASLKPFCEEIDAVIDLIPDPATQEALQKRVDQNKLKIQQRLQLPNKYFPKKISTKKARKQKSRLAQWVNYQLNNLLQAQDADSPNKKDLQDLVNIATVNNLARLYGEKEFSEYSADKIIPILSEYSSLPIINFKTARQYSANNKEFFDSLAKYPAEINIATLCDETEDLIAKLPKKLAAKLEDRVLDELEID